MFMYRVICPPNSQFHIRRAPAIFCANIARHDDALRLPVATACVSYAPLPILKLAAVLLPVASRQLDAFK